MKTLPRMCTFVAIGFALIATPSLAIDPANLNLIMFENRTGDDIRYIFLSPSDSDYWGTDILGSTRVLNNMWGVDQLDRETILEPGDSVRLLLPVVNEEVRYDVHAVDEDKDTYTFFVAVSGQDEEQVYSIVNGDLE